MFILFIDFILNFLDPCFHTKGNSPDKNNPIVNIDNTISDNIIVSREKRL